MRLCYQIIYKTSVRKLLTSVESRSVIFGCVWNILSQSVWVISFFYVTSSNFHLRITTLVA